LTSKSQEMDIFVMKIKHYKEQFLCLHKEIIQNAKEVVWVSVYWYLLDNMNYKEAKTLRLIVRIGNYSADKSRRLNSCIYVLHQLMYIVYI